MSYHHTTFRHSVEFYANDGALCSSIVPNLRRALLAGESAVVVASAPHRRAFLKALEPTVPSPVIAGRLTMRDAAETLSKFTKNGDLDEALFRSVIGGLLERTGEGAKGLFVYGERVDLLWQEGKAYQAIRLEEFWNRLAESMKFTLSCSYHFKDIEQRSEGLGHKKIQRAHSHSAAIDRYPGEAKGSLLVVDDDKEDCECLADILSKHHPSVILCRAAHGAAASDLLHGPGALRPSVILLDLNMPEKDGRQFLSELRTESEFDDIPVAVFTNSSAAADRRFVDCFRNSYFFSKPAGYGQFVQLVNDVVSRHLRLAL